MLVGDTSNMTVLFDSEAMMTVVKENWDFNIHPNLNGWSILKHYKGCEDDIICVVISNPEFSRPRNSTPVRASVRQNTLEAGITAMEASARKSGLYYVESFGRAKKKLYIISGNHFELKDQFNLLEEEGVLEVLPIN